MAAAVSRLLAHRAADIIIDIDTPLTCPQRWQEFVAFNCLWCPDLGRPEGFVAARWRLCAGKERSRKPRAYFRAKLIDQMRKE